MPADRDRHRGQGGAAARHLAFGFASPAVLEQHGPRTLVKGRGVYVWDATGRKYLDGLASLWNVAVGHGRTEIARAVAAQIRAIEFAPTLLGFASLPAQQLAARLARLAPRGLSRVLFTSGGSEANESVIRLVRVYWRLRGWPEKFHIVALTRAYHGSTMGAATLTGLPYFHTYYEPLLPGVLRIPRPFCTRCELGKSYPGCELACADELRRLIEREGAERIGAVIVEPVQGVGGVIVPPPGYLERLRSICDRYDVLLVADEVITGFGRLGTAFGMQRWKLIPDMIVFAKGVTSGYVPLGGVLLQQRIYNTLIDAGPQFTLHHGFTYSGHPVACAAALANLDIMAREHLFRRVRSLAAPFARRLRALARQPIVGEVRAIGLMGAIDLVRDRDRNEPFPPALGVPLRVREAALARGVIVRASADGIVLCPPFVITPRQIDHLTAVLDAACATVGAALRTEGVV